MTHKELEDYILAKQGAWLDHPFGEGVAVYKVGEGGVTPDVAGESRGKMFALIQEGKEPVSISLKCDPVLAEKLRGEYETVQPGYHLNKKHWNTIICSGQLSEDEIYALIDHSYQLVAGSLSGAVENIVD